MKRLWFILILSSIYIPLSFSNPIALFGKNTIDSKYRFTMTTQDYTIKGEHMVLNLNHPWGMTWIDNNAITNMPKISMKSSYLQKKDEAYSLLVTERNGDIWIALGNGDVHKLQGVPDDVYQKGQGGWLDIAYHSDFIYMSYAKKMGKGASTALIRGKVSYKNNKYIMTDIQTLFVAMPVVMSSVHFGAPITFDDKGYVYLGLGERGQRYEAQNKTNNLGSIMRFSLDGSKSSLYSYGHRNVQGIFFDVNRKQLFAHEHGPQGGDEINLVQEGNNYGWPIISYGVEYRSGKKIGEGTKKSGMEQPLHYWIPSPALSGMTVYYGDMFRKWRGNVIIGALKFESLYRVVLTDKKRGIRYDDEEIMAKNQVGRIRSIKQGIDDALYILTDKKNGSLIRLAPVE